MGLRDVGDVGRRAGQAMDQPGLRVRADVRFHPKVPLVPLLDLVHLGIARLARVLGRGWRGDDRGIDNRTFSHE